MADEQAPQYPTPDGQHDTSVLSWPTAGVADPSQAAHEVPTYGKPGYGQPGYGQFGPGQPGYGQPGFDQTRAATGYRPEYPAGATPEAGYAVAPDGRGGWVPAGVGNPEADYWAARFRRQRMWTRLLGASIAAALLLVVGGGVFVWKVVVPSAASSVSQGLNGVLPDLGLPDPGTGDQPGTTTPDGGPANPNQQDLSDVPLPEGLQGLGSMLGIDNMEQLLDTAVSMGLMTPERADQIRTAVAGGQSLEGLLGGQLGGAQGLLGG